MDNSSQELDFLDWSEITENDRQHLQNVLYVNDPNAVYPQLPWSTNQPAPCVQNEAEWIPANYGSSEDIIQESGLECTDESLLAPPEQFQSPPMATLYIPSVSHNIYVNNLTQGVIGLPMPYAPPPQTMYHIEDNTNRRAARQKNSNNGKTLNPGNEATAQPVAVGTSFAPPYVNVISYPRPPPTYYLSSNPYASYHNGLVFPPFSNPEAPIAIDKSVTPVVPITYGPAVAPYTTQNYTEMTSNQNYSQDSTYIEQNEIVSISEEVNPLDVIHPIENIPHSFQQTSEISNETSIEVQNNLEVNTINTNKESSKTDISETNPSIDLSNKQSEVTIPKVSTGSVKAKVSTHNVKAKVSTDSVNASTSTPKHTPKLWTSLFNGRHTHLDKNYDPNNSAPESTTSSNPEIKDRRSSEEATSKLTINSSPPSGPDPGLYRLGEFLRDYEVDHRNVSLQPRGLTNRSNWCYIHSTLQALFACPPFYNLLKSLSNHYGSRPASSTKSSTPILDSMIQLVGEFSPMTKGEKSRLSRNTRNNGGKKSPTNTVNELPDLSVGQAIEPLFIYNMLDNIRSDSFKVQGRQEDAEEFLSCLLNALNDEMLEVIKLVEDSSNKSTKSSLTNGVGTNGFEYSANKDNHDGWNGNSKQNGSQNIEDDSEEWAVMGPKNKSAITRRAELGSTPVSKIFRGQLCSKIHRTGDQDTSNVQPFFTLQLDIEKAHSVEEALDILGTKDQIEGMTSSKTNKAVEAWKQVSIGELPQILLLHLKWFDYKLNGCSKIVKNVKFPIELKLDPKLLSTKKLSNSKERQYRLFAVVYHDGKEANKGHYITDAYHVGYGCWIRYDDNIVRPIHENQMLHPKEPRVPYILYYRRLNPTSGDKTR